MRVAIGSSSFAQEEAFPLELLKQHAVEIMPNPYGRRLTEEETIAHLEGADGLIAGLEPLTEKVFSCCPQLKAVARVGIGMDTVDLDSAKKYGIKVSNTPNEPTQAVAELTLAAMLSLSRQLWPMNQALHEKKWNKMISMGLRNAVVLIVGYGRIGKAVARMLQPFGPDIWIADPFVQKQDLLFGETLVSLSEGLHGADIITLHVSGSGQVLGSNEFNQIKKGAILLNAGRGQLVCEDSLLKALDNGTIQSAWLDVFNQEPYSGLLANYPQVLLTPHVGTYTKSCRKSMETAAAKNLLKDLGYEI